MISTLPSKLSSKHLFLFWLGLHILAALVFYLLTPQNGLDILYFWDSSWYSKIALEGYVVPEYGAFLPLYPKLLSGLNWLFGGWIETGLIGSFLSLILFGFCIFKVIPEWVSLKKGSYVSPILGLALLMFAPASFVFHTNHTEALFLVLSLLSFYSAEKSNWLVASIAAGLAIWTRHQGLFVALVAGLILLNQGDRKKFVLVGLLTSAFFATLLARNYVFFDDWLFHFNQQSHWQKDESIWHPLLAMVFQNPTQTESMSIGRLVHGGFFYLFLFASCLLGKKNWPYMVYAFLSLFAVVKQGEFSNAFRFLGVVFPVFFLIDLERVPIWIKRLFGFKWVTVLFFATYIAFNLFIWTNYMRGKWAY